LDRQTIEQQLKIRLGTKLINACDWMIALLPKDIKFPPRPTHLPWIAFSGFKQSVSHRFPLDKYTALVQVY
jgi:hypothetical protein